MTEKKELTVEQELKIIKVRIETFEDYINQSEAINKNEGKNSEICKIRAHVFKEIREYCELIKIFKNKPGQ